MWTLSNLAASLPRHIEALVHHQVFKTVVELCEVNHSAKVRQEAVYTLTNAITTSGDDKLMLSLIDERILYILVETLKVAKGDTFID